MGGTSATKAILATGIRQDAEGRYCLNDCHRAAGGDPSKRPGEWLRNAHTQGLIAELTDAENPASPVSAIHGGPSQGTFVVEDLVYSYAMWISFKFHLQVVRAFRAMVEGRLPAAAPAPAPVAPAMPFPEFLRAFATKAEECDELRAALGLANLELEMARATPA